MLFGASTHPFEVIIVSGRQRSAHLGENKRITSEPQKSIGLFMPIFIITPSGFFLFYNSGEKKSISDELEFGSRDGKPSLEKNREGGWKSVNKMFFYLSAIFSCPNY